MKIKKTNKIKVNKKTVKRVLKKVNFKKLGMTVIALVLAGGFYWYGMVAMVNGKPVWRWTYVKNMEKQVGEQVLDQMVNEALIAVEAGRKGVEIEQAVIDEEVANIKTRLEGQQTSLDEALAAEGMVMADLEEQIRNQKLVEKLAEVSDEISQEQIEQFLEMYKDQLPEDMSEEELNDLAKEQLAGQAQNEGINSWLTKLKDEAKIIYR